jgi:hypothetical protein
MPSSPEGVMVQWVDSSDSGYYITRGNARQQLNLDSDSGGDYNRDNFRFLGWVTN